jgi:thiol:disulfide interchange protein
MFKKLMLGLLAGGVLGQAGAADLNWQTDLTQALSQAKAEKKLVLMDFTGSDWCEACQLLDKTMLDQPEFATYAKTNLVLLQADFPVKKPQTNALKSANQALAEKFKIDGYPTLIALKADGTAVWRLEGVNDSFLAGGPKALIAQLNGVQK